MLSEEKIIVFISSRCGGERINFDKLVNNPTKGKEDIAKAAVRANYDLIRRALRLSLEATGFIRTYTFEDEHASTVSAQDDYLNQLDSCHVCLFLIDNFDEKIPFGVLKEITRAQKLKKKSIYLFLNHPNYEKTSVQASLTGPNGGRYMEIQDIREFIDKGYESVIANIRQIYQMYCRGRLNVVEEDKTSLDIPKENFSAGTVEIDKQILKNLVLTKNKLIDLLYLPEVQDVPSSDLDKFCRAILEILLGEKAFGDLNFTGLLQSLKDIQSPQLYELVSQRWKAISDLHNGDLDSSTTILESLYNKFSEITTIPNWFLNDILIDWRYINGINEQSKNIIDVSVHEKVNQLNSFIFFPLVDRFGANVSDELLDRDFKELTSSPYSATIYNSDWLFGYISNYLFTAIYYGSYTYITLTLKQIQRVLFDAVQRTDNLIQKVQLMRVSILLGNEGDFEKIMYKYGSSLSYSTTKEILDLYELAEKKPTIYQKVGWKLIIFKELGYYFSDSDYESISNELWDLSQELLTDAQFNANLIRKLIDALKSNKERISQEKIVRFAIEVLKKKYYRFFDSVFELLRQLNILTMNRDLIMDLISQIKLLAVDEKAMQQDQNLKRLLVSIRKRQADFSGEVDWLVERHFPEFYEQDYHLEVFPGERLVHLQRYIEKIRVRNQIQGKDGKFIGFVDQPYITIKNIIELGNLSLSEELLNSLLTVIRITLLTEKQSYSEKIDAAKLLLYLKQQSWTEIYDWNEFYSNIKQNVEEIQKGHSSLFESEQPFLLQLYLVFLQITFGDDVLKDLLEILALTSSSSNAEIIGSLAALGDFLKSEKHKLERSSLIPIMVQYISSFCFHEDDNIRFYTVEALYQLLDTEYSDFIVSRLARMMEDAAFRIKLAVLHQASLVKNYSLSTYNYLGDKAKIDQNYLVRKLGKIKVG